MQTAGFSYEETGTSDGGELHDITPEQGLEYVGYDRNELKMAFQFEVIDVNPACEGHWNLCPTPVSFMKQTIAKWQGGARVYDLFGAS